MARIYVVNAVVGEREFVFVNVEIVMHHRMHHAVNVHVTYKRDRPAADFKFQIPSLSKNSGQLPGTYFSRRCSF